MPNSNLTIGSLPGGRSGAIQERFAYQPYGQSEPLNPNFSAYSGTDYQWEYRFTGRELDLESGLQINRQRYFHLQLGRWIIRDAIEYGDGPSTISYIGDNPTNGMDPFGMAKELPPDQQKELKDCAACTTRDGGPDKDQLGWVECDGKGGIKPGTRKPKDFPEKTPSWLKGAFDTCGISKCTRVHEAWHVEQIDLISPDVCKGKPKGAIVQIDVKCKDVAECRATEQEIDCLKKQLEQLKKKDKPYTDVGPDGTKTKRPCSGAVSAYLSDLTKNAEKVYKCKDRGIPLA